MYWKSNQYLKEEYPFFPRNLESIRGSEELKSLAEKSLVRGSFLINKFKNSSVKKTLNIIFSIKQFKIYRLLLYSSHFFSSLCHFIHNCSSSLNTCHWISMSFRCLLMAFESYSLNKSVLSPNDVFLLWPVPNLLVPPAPAIPSALARLAKQGCSASFQYCLLQGKTFSVEVRLPQGRGWGLGCFQDERRRCFQGWLARGQ